MHSFFVLHPFLTAKIHLLGGMVWAMCDDEQCAIDGSCGMELG